MANAPARKSDGRSTRRAKVVPFLSRIEIDKKNNLLDLISSAQQLLPQIPGAVWAEPIWSITSGRLLVSAGKNVMSATLAFCHGARLGDEPLQGDFADLAKALVTRRFFRANQALENQRNFVAAFSYLAANAKNRDVARITVGDLDAACDAISRDYSDGTAYNMHKAINEIAAHCDANGLCLSHFDYRYARMRRPRTTGGTTFRRLDDPQVLEPDPGKMVAPAVYELLGELYRKVPFWHPHRIHLLVLTIIAAIGRRFSEVALLTLDCLAPDSSGKTPLKYFPRKASHGNAFTPARNLWPPTLALDILQEAVTEAIALCAPARGVAARMRATNGPDLSFLEAEPPGKKYYRKDLEALKLPSSLLDARVGWLRNNGFARCDAGELSSRGERWYATREGLEAYCRRDFHPTMLEEIHRDQHGNSFFLDDLLFCVPAYLGGAGGALRAFWLSTKYSHSMLDQFLFAQLPIMAKEFAPDIAAELDFTSHEFRHTINTLLDEGGLPDLLQTKWFGRSNPRDTKAYQHTSREKKVLLIRDALKSGNAGGRIATALKKIPASLHDAYLAARVDAVHEVGPGFCVHKFVQTPCPRHLQCSADCDDYVWVSGDEDRKIELMTQWAFATVALETALARQQSGRAQLSSDWVEHNRKKLETLSEQLLRNNIAQFDAHAFLQVKARDEG